MSTIYRYTGFYSSLSYLFAAPLQEQANLCTEDDNTMLEVDDKQQHFICNRTRQIGANPPSKQHWVYYRLPRAARKCPFTVQDET